MTGLVRRRRVTVPEQRWAELWHDSGVGPPEGGSPESELSAVGELSAVDIEVWDLAGPPPGPVELVVLPYLAGTAGLDGLTGLPGLQVVQTLTAGYDNVLPYLPDGVTLCNAAGVHDTSTAELAVALTLAAQRGLADFARAARTGAWLFGVRPALADRRVLLLGTGGVGRAIAARLAPFEVVLTRVASHARSDAAGRVHGVDELPRLLPAHDVVILAVPLTGATRGLVDAGFLAAMPDGGLLVNVARGPVVVTDDLVAEVSTGRLRAALDVTDPEPLPPGHPLWSCPGVLISPHVGGNTSAFEPRARALLRDQLRRLVSGRPLRNVVAGPAR